MADVGLGERVTAYGRYRSKVARDALKDNLPIFKVLEDNKGVEGIAGGRTYLDESLTAQNSTVSWVGEAGQVSLANQRVIDSPEASWSYIMGSINMTRAEQLMNEGQGRYIDVYAAKQEALEASTMNIIGAGLLSSGTGTGGLQVDGLAAAISTTPTSGTYNSIDRSSANAAWFRNQKFDTASDWSLGSVDAGNVKKFFDKLINNTMKEGQVQLSACFAGSTHYEFLTDAIGAMQVIQNQNGTGHAGFDKLRYRGVDVYFGGGVNYSGQSALTATRTYGLCCKKGGFRLIHHKKAWLDMMAPVDSADQAAFSRIMFSMLLTTLGAYAKLNIVGFD